MFARFDKMAKQFTRIGKDIAIAVKQAGPDPDNNPRLRAALLNAKGINMPKDRLDAAIKRASNKDEKDLAEVVYEGYGPYGVAIVVETATDNPNRTVANVRSYFTRAEGALSTAGALDFVFTRKGVFKLDPTKVNIDEIELDLIDLGAEDIIPDEEEIQVITAFENFGRMQHEMVERKISYINAELQRLPLTTVDLTEEQTDEIMKLILKLEEDDDVQAVYHNIA